MDAILKNLQIEIEHHLGKIEKLLPNHDLTLIANYSGDKDLKDADIVLSRSNRSKINEALDKWHT